MRLARLAVALVLFAGCGSEVEPTTPTTPAPELRTAPPAPPPSSAVDPCAVGRARIASVVAAARPAGAGGDDWETGGLDALATQLGETCTATGGGAWIVLLSEVTLPAAGATTTTTTSHAAFVDTAGEVHVGSQPVSIELDPEMGGSGEIRFERLFDWNGDGTTEAIVRVDARDYESVSTRRWLVAYADGAVGPYAAAADVALDQVVDPDGDGRPDLVGRWHGWAGTECGEDPPIVGTPPVLFHSLPDGSFSTSDEAASAFLRAACPAAPDRLLGTTWPCGEQEARGRIACARAWGATADDVRARMATEREALSVTARALGSWDELDAYATQDPPLVLH